MKANLDPAEVIYLDLDDDGVPDAVLTRRVVYHHATGDDHVDIVDTTTTIESEIGIDGVAGSTETYNELVVDGRLRLTA